MPNLLTSITSLDAESAQVSYAEMRSMSATVSVAGTGSIVMLLANASILMNNSTDKYADARFSDDGTLFGPEMAMMSSDAADEGESKMMIWCTSGLTGSHTFALQWQRGLDIPELDTARPRSFQVIELLEGEADLLANITANSAGTAPVAYAPIEALSGAFTVGSTNSVVMLMSNVTPTFGTGDFNADFQFSDDGTLEGPESTLGWSDSNTRGAWSAMIWSKTGIDGSHTLAIQWKRRSDIPTLNTSRVRSFQMLELKSADLLTSITAQSALNSNSAAPVSYQDVDALSGSQTISDTGSVVFMAGFVPIALDESVDKTVDFQFADGLTREGPEITGAYQDTTNEGSHAGLAWATSGIEGSHTFSLQWQDRKGTPDLDQTRNRTFQVIEFKAVADGGPSETAKSMTGIAIGVGSLTRLVAYERILSGIASTDVSTFSREADYFRQFDIAETPVGTLEKKSIYQKIVSTVSTVISSLTRIPIFSRIFNSIVSGVGSLLRVVSYKRIVNGIASGLGSLTTAIIVKRILNAVALGVGTLSRVVIRLRTFSVIASHSVSLLALNAKFVTMSAIALGVGSLTRSVTFLRTLDVVGLGATTLSRTVTYVRTFNATDVGIVVLNRTVKYLKTLDSSALGIVSLVFVKFRNVVMNSIVVVVVSLGRVGLYLRTFNSVATIIATLSKTLSLFRTFNVIASHVASLVALNAKFITMNAVASGISSLTKTISYFRILSVSEISVATLSRVVTYLRTLASTAIGIASLSAIKGVTQVIMSTIAIGVSSLSRTVAYKRILTSVETSIASITRVVTYFRTLSSIATLISSLTTIIPTVVKKFWKILSSAFRKDKFESQTLRNHNYKRDYLIEEK